MEHAIPPSLVAELEHLLDHPEVDPHGHPIPAVHVFSAGGAAETPT